MILERSLHPRFLSNTYLLADAPGGHAAFVDAGGPLDPLLEAIERDDLTVTHVLLTHHHWDHVEKLGTLRERFPRARVLAHPIEAELIDGDVAPLQPDETIAVGGLEVRALHTPGHTAGMLSLLIEPDSGPPEVFTGDTLFKGSVGGVRAPGSTSFADIRHSILDVLLALPGETIVRPGHTDPSTVEAEFASNRFVRMWRGEEPEGDQPCTALGDPATLILLGDDYDGGYKAWVRWPDGSDDIVPGSKVETG